MGIDVQVLNDLDWGALRTVRSDMPLGRFCQMRTSAVADLNDDFGRELLQVRGVAAPMPAMQNAPFALPDFTTMSNGTDTRGPNDRLRISVRKRSALPQEAIHQVRARRGDSSTRNNLM